jgi:hypothetical protein
MNITVMTKSIGMTPTSPSAFALVTSHVAGGDGFHSGMRVKSSVVVQEMVDQK